MPSPFPGMNPYLESADAWQTFHSQFLSLVQAALVEQVRPDFIVKLEDHLYIHEFSAEERRFIGRADVSVVAPDRLGITTSSAIQIAPVMGQIPLAVDIQRESYIEISDRRSRRLVAVMELLSPSNKKSGSDRDQFLSKRHQLLRSNTHYVELDLLRGGPRLPIEGLPDCDYYVLVSRVETRPHVGLWPIGLRDPLPEIAVPLSGSHPDAWLDLQALLHSTYDAGGYEDYIYTGSPEPPLPEPERTWAESLAPARSI